MSVNGAARGNARGTTANRAVTAVIDGVGHRRLMLPTARQEIQNSSTRSALVPTVQRASVRPLSVRSRCMTTRTLTQTMVQLMNHRCVDSDKSFSAAVTAPDRRPNKRAPLPPPTTATLRCFFASPSATATTEPTPATESAPPAAVPTATEIPPAPSPTSRQPSASTIDVDGDVGMTPEPLDRAPAPPPDDDNDDPSLPAPTDTETAANAGEDPIPACPPVTVAAANRANATARDDPEAAPGPAVTPDAGADLPGYFVTAADRLLDSAYGDHVHDNDGTHLHGDFSDDALWQRRWRRMAQIATTRYQAPAG
ncbi:hypothetical protein MHU86_7102 [Fragilaria crotonensis]|nr:hypothetical protein MHU86_7102 [Fragilaria crotonensis]